MRPKEQARLKVLNMVLEGQCRVAEAAKVLRVSERHGWRLLAAYRKEGAAALVHGNRGRQPAHTTAKEVKERVVELAQGPYDGANHSHFTELLAERERERIVLSRSTVRRILMARGLKSPRKRRPPKHRARRDRMPQEGMLLQIDGSPHLWLEERGPRLTLIGAVDDATGTVPYALFREQEDAQGYFLLLREILRTKGIPTALYSDRHTIFQRPAQEKESLEEQLEGKREPTQFGRALEELGIQSILALSPQAKGRIERLWGTFQDRLVTELRLARASTLEEAQVVLQEYLPRYNARFAVPAAQPGSTYRPLAKGLCLEGILCFKYRRTVAGDNTIRFFRRSLQLLPGLDRVSYTHARVEVQERLDGSLVVVYQGKTIATQEAPPQPVTLRARSRASGASNSPGNSVVAPPQRGHDTASPQASDTLPRKPKPDHPWRFTGRLRKWMEANRD